MSNKKRRHRRRIKKMPVIRRAQPTIRAVRPPKTLGKRPTVRRGHPPRVSTAIDKALDNVPADALPTQATPADTLRESAMMWYMADIYRYLGKLNRPRTRAEIQALAEEVSYLSLRAPIWYRQDLYEKGEWKRIIESAKEIDKKKLKLITVDSDNNFMVKYTGDKKYTPLHLLTIMYWGVEELSGRQLSERKKYGWIRSARMIA